jgi:hypothetical protein
MSGANCDQLGVGEPPNKEPLTPLEAEQFFLTPLYFGFILYMVPSDEGFLWPEEVWKQSCILLRSYSDMGSGPSPRTGDSPLGIV